MKVLQLCVQAVLCEVSYLLKLQWICPVERTWLAWGTDIFQPKYATDLNIYILHFISKDFSWVVLVNFCFTLIYFLLIYFPMTWSWVYRPMNVIILTPGAGNAQHRFNMNHYATKKSAAQSMLDVALLMANSSQLKTVLHSGAQHRFSVPLIALISLSISLQVIVGLLLIFIG